MDEHGEWCGSVIPSALDSRVWVAVVPDVDTATGAMGASTSLRRCKAHVQAEVTRCGMGDVTWHKEGDSWAAYIPADGADLPGGTRR